MAKPTSKLGKRDLTSRNCSSSSNSSSTDDTVSIRDHDRFRDNSTTLLKRKRRRGPRESPPQRSSVYRGVTRHRWTGRYEAHLWDKNCWNESQKKKGRQVYLGAYDDEAAAARAYDLAALKYWGTQTLLNFPLSTYESALTEMEGLSREEYIGSLRRKSNGFSRGVSKYRGVARHHHNGRWEARIGRVFGNKYLYLGTYATQEEAATAYDIAAIEYRGVNAVTNFDLNRYTKWLKPNNSEIQPNIFSHFGDAKSSDSTTSTLSFDNNLDLIHDQVEKAICIGESMWARSSLIDCSSTLLDDDGKLLHCDHPIGEAQTYMEGQGSSCNDVGNGDEDFFSDLSSFLCDFDKLEAEHVGLQIPENQDCHCGD